MSDRPYKLAIAALGGQGGGVLTDWLIHIAEAEQYLVQTTSVPGVAQRTGATIYYLEFFPRAAAERAGRDPVLALMPASGDVDCVVAAELAEAARAIQRGIVTPERTTLIASSHRVYTIAEKSALGSGIVDEAELVKLARAQSKRLVVFDMAALAEAHGSMVSATLLGAIAGAGVLPFSPDTFRTAIREGGIAVEANLRAFEAALERASSLAPISAQVHAAPALAPVPADSRSRAAAPVLARMKDRFPPDLQPLVLEGARRLIDYQDVAYAHAYLERLERVLALDAASHDFRLTEATARSLALWMSFEDTIRVADLKTRLARFERVASEIKADARQVVGLTEFMKPRVEELAGTMPAGLGRRVLASARARRMLARFTGGRHVRTSTVSGFLLLRGIARLRRFRRGTLRFRDEDARIRAWLERIERLAPRNYDLAVEVARAQRLVKGYGDTHERGVRNFEALMANVDALEGRANGAALLAELHEAALADEEGAELARRQADLAAAPAR